MGNLLGRIQKRLNMTVSAFRADCHYSVKLALYRLGDELGGRLGLEALSWKCNQKKHQWILGYLQEKYADLLEAYSRDEKIGTFQENAPIWVCWWDGEDKAPALVRQCIKSIRANAGTHPVHLITKENYGTYLQIPSFIAEKLGCKQLGIANFSDYLRFSLLNQYGGLWLDSTIYCGSQILDEYFEKPLFTCRSQKQKTKYISGFRWTSFCFGGWRGHSLFSFFQSAFEKFWKEENQAIDYLFVDYIIALATNEMAFLRTQLDSIPFSNPHRDDLQAAMNEKTPAEKWDEIIHPDTVFYKLSWRERYEAKTDAGESTVYEKLLNMEWD